MRSFQLIFIVLFLIFYLFISYGTIKSIRTITPYSKKMLVTRLLILISVLIFGSFVLLYIWPMSTPNLKDYMLHLIFNAILSVDFAFKITVALSFLAGIFYPVKQKPIIYAMGLILSIAISIAIIYGSLFGTKEMVVNNVELKFSDLPKNYNSVKILQISDIHLGNFLKSKKVLQKVQLETKKIDPDIILFTGDLVNNFASEIEGYSDVFTEISQNKQCYSILGNHDYGNYSNWISEDSKKENFNKIEEAHNNFGFRLLNNEHVILKSNNDSIYIIGVENWGHPPFPQYANLEKAMKGIPENSFKILLSHDPAHWEEVIKNRGDIELTLSGHTHGLQWGIKKAGITFSLGYVSRKNWGGLYKYANSQLYVNTGLGTIGVPWRINMPAEMTVLTLKRIEID